MKEREKTQEYYEQCKLDSTTKYNNIKQILKNKKKEFTNFLPN